MVYRQCVKIKGGFYVDLLGVVMGEGGSLFRRGWYVKLDMDNTMVFVPRKYIDNPKWKKETPV